MMLMFGAAPATKLAETIFGTRALEITGIYVGDEIKCHWQPPCHQYVQALQISGEGRSRLATTKRDVSRRTISQVLTRLQSLPLLKAFLPQPSFSSLPPRQKARMLVQSIQDITLGCLREQQHIITQDRIVRRAMLIELAESLTDHWIPLGLTPADMDHIEPWMIRNIVLNTAEGIPLAAYESAIFARFQQAEENPPMPAVPVNQHRGGPHSGRRAGPRRRVQ